MDDDLVERKVTYLLELVDRDGDRILDVIDYEEWVDRLGALRGWEPGTPGYEALLTLFVRNGFRQMAASSPDNRLDLADMGEILVTMARRHERDVYVWAATLFDLLDADHDGVIGREEHRDLLASLCVSREAADEAFDRIDVDRCGEISHDRFARLYVDFFLSEDPDDPASWFWGPGPVSTPSRRLALVRG